MAELIFLDFETTGLGTRRTDEIVEVGIIDSKGSIIMDTLVRPVERKTWRSAQKVHGIAPKDVKNVPTFEELEPEFTEAISGNNVVIFNASFDLRFIPMHSVEKATAFYCAMRLFRRAVPDSRRYRLEDALEWANERTGGERLEHTHRAVGDSRVTLFVWNAISGHLGEEFEKYMQECKADPTPPGRREERVIEVWEDDTPEEEILSLRQITGRNDGENFACQNLVSIMLGIMWGPQYNAEGVQSQKELIRELSEKMIRKDLDPSDEYNPVFLKAYRDTISFLLEQSQKVAENLQS